MGTTAAEDDEAADEHRQSHLLTGLNGFELFEGLFAVVALVHRPAQRWPERVDQLGVGAVAIRAHGLFERVVVELAIVGGWWREAEIQQDLPALLRDVVARPSAIAVQAHVVCCDTVLLQHLLDVK